MDKSFVIIILALFGCIQSQPDFTHSVPINSIRDYTDSELDSVLNIYSNSCYIPDVSEISNFSEEDTLKVSVVLSYIYPDSNYTFQHNERAIIDSLNRYFQSEKIQHSLVRVDNIFEPGVLKSYSNYVAFMNAFKKDDAFYIFIFPKGSAFIQEVSNGRRTHTVNGAALSVLSNSCFIREEISTTPVLPHEVGHMYGLLHTFQKNGEDDQWGYSCVSGDYIADTPYVNVGDKIIFNEVGTCNYYTTDTLYPDKFKSIILCNFLSYAHTSCLNSFTPLQGKTMRKNLLTVFKDKLIDESPFKIDYRDYLYTTTN